MTYEFYKVMHLLGLILLFSGLSSALALKMSGVPFAGPVKKMAFIMHGVGLVIMVIAGFGLAARMGLMGNMPGWIYAKITIWVVLAISISLAKRKGQIGWPLMVLFVGLGTTAAWLAVTKPF
ncbi:MAG: hypothetical protein EON58_17805 [Alphaproteobacteria bacterium]|nr:MAG: hypothetical protein EON58_17805 [Alphaproteobacteria bacterium]